LIKVTKTDITNKDALALYNTMAEAVFADQSVALFNQGRDTYNNGKYDDAIKLLRDSLKMDPDNVDSIYFLGRAYDRKGDSKRAEAFYRKVLTDYSNSNRAPEARSRLKALGVTLE
jgi:TolA-binding protein